MTVSLIYYTYGLTLSVQPDLPVSVTVSLLHMTVSIIYYTYGLTLSVQPELPISVAVSLSFM